MRLFDAHSHMHLGQSGLVIPSAAEQIPFAFDGAAIMSTAPCDYDKVDAVVGDLQDRGFRSVPCYGVHPWFLYDVLTSSDGDSDWLNDLRKRLLANPDAIVGEIGLDGNRWVEVKQSDQSTEENIWKRERVLACPMEMQRKAFEEQLVLAAELQRPVSIHVVSSWGELFAAFDSVCERMKHKKREDGYNNGNYYDNDNNEREEERKVDKRRKSQSKKLKLLPPRIYFHAFSGKLGLLPSIRSACKKGNIPFEDVYFGFPPAIKNFYSPKTPKIMKEVGLRHLLLETDLEDATSAWDDLKTGVNGIAEALQISESDVARETCANAHRFYFDTTEDD